MQKQSVQVTREFLAACAALAAKPAERGSTVPERAQEIVSYARAGQWLEPWRVEIVMCLITRLEPYEAASPGSWQQQQAVLDAWKQAPRKEVS